MGFVLFISKSFSLEFITLSFFLLFCVFHRREKEWPEFAQSRSAFEICSPAKGSWPRRGLRGIYTTPSCIRCKHPSFAKAMDGKPLKLRRVNAMARSSAKNNFHMIAHLASEKFRTKPFRFSFLDSYFICSLF